MGKRKVGGSNISQLQFTILYHHHDSPSTLYYAPNVAAAFFFPPAQNYEKNEGVEKSVNVKVSKFFFALLKKVR